MDRYWKEVIHVSTWKHDINVQYLYDTFYFDTGLVPEVFLRCGDGVGAVPHLIPVTTYVFPYPGTSWVKVFNIFSKTQDFDNFSTGRIQIAHTQKPDACVRDSDHLNVCNTILLYQTNTSYSHVMCKLLLSLLVCHLAIRKSSWDKNTSQQYRYAPGFKD